MYVILIIILTLCILASIFLVSFAFPAEDEEVKLAQKVQEEIKYIETTLFSMLNELQNISFDMYKLTVENEEKQNTTEGAESSQEESSSSSEESSSSENTSKENQTQKKYSMENASILLNKNQEIDWDYQKMTIETLYPYWNTTMVDLHAICVNGEDITTFSRITR